MGFRSAIAVCKAFLIDERILGLDLYLVGCDCASILLWGCPCNLDFCAYQSDSHLVHLAGLSCRKYVTLLRVLAPSEHVLGTISELVDSTGFDEATAVGVRDASRVWIVAY